MMLRSLMATIGLALALPALAAPEVFTVDPEHTYPQSRRYGSRYLQLINGRPPTAEQIQAFECTQILQLEHGFNASTFTASVAVTDGWGNVVSDLGSGHRVRVTESGSGT